MEKMETHFSLSSRHLYESKVPAACRHSHIILDAYDEERDEIHLACSKDPWWGCLDEVFTALNSLIVGQPCRVLVCCQAL